MNGGKVPGMPANCGPTIGKRDCTTCSSQFPLLLFGGVRVVRLLVSSPWMSPEVAADVRVYLLPTACRLSYQFFQLLLHQLCDRCNFRVWILGVNANPSVSHSLIHITGHLLT